MSNYSDIRKELFTRLFESGLPYQQYVKTGEPAHQERWRDAESRTSLTNAQSQLLGSFTRKMNILVLSGTWCGDCVRQGPMFARIEEASSVFTFRYLDNRSTPEAQNELRINGAEKVPVVVVLSEDFFELARFGDRHLSVYRRKAAKELGPSCELGLLPPEKGELELEIQEWCDYFERIQLMLRLAPLLRKRYGD